MDGLGRVLTRRTLAQHAMLLGGAGLGGRGALGHVAALATPVAASDADLSEALAGIDQVVAEAMAAGTIPGLALALTDRQGLLATREYGYANLATQTPITAETIFAYGSIGKSFTAACLLQLAEEGRVDLHAPVIDYLPWFRVSSPYPPITLHHLLTHTAGIIAGDLFSPDPRYEVWALRETVVGSPPGTHFWYSNDGYQTLGLVIEAVTGQAYGDVVQERLFTPLGMRQAVKALTNDVRPRLAVGRLPCYDDRPALPRYGVAAAPWVESNAGDGSLAATASDLALWLQMLLNEGAGSSGHILSAESFAQMRGPHVEVDSEYAYGYGIASGEGTSQPWLGHHGTVVGFESHMLGFPEAGLGVVVLINGPEDPTTIAYYVLDLLLLAHEGHPLPALPLAPDVTLTPNAVDYTGTYRGAGWVLRVTAAGGRLLLEQDAESIVLLPQGDDAFLADHPDFALFPLRFGRDAHGAVVELIHGPGWYTNERYAGPTTFVTPPAWDAYTGHYRSTNSYSPWFSNFHIVLRKGTLLRIEPDGEETMLVPVGETFRQGEEAWLPERIAFDTIVDGRALRAVVNSNAEYYRFFTP